MNCLECKNFWQDKVDQEKCVECIAKRNAERKEKTA